MKNKILIFLLCLSSFVFSADEPLNLKANKDEKLKSSTILEYPGLEKFLFEPPKSNFYFGIGAAPVGLVGSKFSFTMNLFQFHYLTDKLDLELISASVGKVFSNSDLADSTTFAIRSVPKINLMKIMDTGTLSIGPLVGIELVKFDDVKTRIRKAVPGTTQFLTTENSINLTTVGLTYGVVLSQTFKLKSGNRFKINEFFYKQTYDISKTRFDWEYLFDDSRLDDNDPARGDLISQMEANSVFGIEFSYIF